MGKLRPIESINNQGEIGSATNPNTGTALQMDRENQRLIMDLQGALPLQTATIQDGAITPQGSNVIVDTEGQSQEDFLEIINTIRSADDSIHEGMILSIKAADETRKITVKNSDATMGINTVSGEDVVLGTTWWLELQYVAGVWTEKATKATNDIQITKEEFNAKFSIVAKEGTAPLAILDPETGKVVFDDTWKMSGGGGLGIGDVVPTLCTATYIPFGRVPCDGAIYSAAQFPNVVEYIEADRIPWKSFADYTAALTADGKEAFFGYDAASASFRVPLIPNGTFIQQAQDDGELGKAYKAGLPNIKGDFSAQVVPDLATGAFTVQGGFSGKAQGASTGGQYVTSFDASRYDSAYGSSDTVQPSSIALRYYVVVATETDQQSVMDWSAWATGLVGKANADLSNVSSNANANLGNEYRVIYGTGQRAVYDPLNDKAIEDDALGTNGTISYNSTYTLENPFGINTPISCKVEIYVNGIWSDPLLVSGATTASSHGTQAQGIQGVGIHVGTASNRVFSNPGYTGAAYTSTSSTSAPCRVHVWKIGV